MFWKIYFFLMVAMTIGGIVLPTVLSLDDSNETDSSEVFEGFVLMPLYIAQLVGLFGYAYARSIATRRSWQWIFGASIAEALWMLYGFISEVPLSDVGTVFVIGLGVTIVPLYLVLFVGLYSYAFRSPELWTKAT